MELLSIKMFRNCLGTSGGLSLWMDETILKCLFCLLPLSPNFLLPTQNTVHTTKYKTCAFHRQSCASTQLNICMHTRGAFFTGFFFPIHKYAPSRGPRVLFVCTLHCKSALYLDHEKS